MGKAKALADLIASPAMKGQLAGQMLDYWTDAAQRTALTIDALRERANNDAAHEAAGAPPVLIYDYETVVDGRDAEAPGQLYAAQDPAPYGSRDPRLEAALHDHRSARRTRRGHWRLEGPDSQVGVALPTATRSTSSPFGLIPNADRRSPT